MRMLWLTHFLPYPATGHGTLQRTHHLLRQASERHEIHLVALSAPTVLPSREEIAQAVAELSELAASVEAFPLPRDHGARRALCAATACVGSRSFWERWCWWRPMQRHLQRLVRTIQFDLVQLETVFLARYLEALPGIPVVVDHHNVESHLVRRRAASQHTPWTQAFFQREERKVIALERAVVPRAAQNLVVSDLDGQRLREVAATAKITTVPNGVDVDFFRARCSTVPETKSLIFAGGMNWFPNRDAITFFVSEIWPALIRDDPQRTMTIIGRDPPPVLRAAARDPRLRVLGFVDDVRPHLDAASIYICPIRVGGGTRLKILDALAMSRPLVASDLAVEGLGLAEGKHFLSANTPEQFVTQIRRLEADTGLRRRLGDAGRAFVVERYSWRRIAESLERAYAEVAEFT